ncbi:MAG: aminoacyl-tRNA hydrolase [Atopostipes suicloacalis]|nr:aminoacyl-tRNA hydrolase [Atopostipes suicloacalis]
MKLIIGLGNPGAKYQLTKHNIGFTVVDQLAKTLNVSFNQTKFKSLYAEAQMGAEKIVLIKPQTFMNLSGEAVQPWIDFYKLSSDDFLIIYDDMDLAVGKIRLRLKGGSGGHNGMKSIIQQLNGKEFNRIRVGIGRPYPKQTVVSHVLSPFRKEDEAAIKEAIYVSVDAIKYWTNNHTFQETMNEFN